MKKITKAEVKKLASLAKLAVSEEGIPQLQKEMQAILKYIEKINVLDTANVEPTAQVTELVNAFREDAVQAQDTKTMDALVACAPEKHGRYIKVKAVLQEKSKRS